MIDTQAASLSKAVPQFPDRLSPRRASRLTGLALMSLAVLAGLPQVAIGDTLCVNPGGTSGCFATIAAAVAAAAPGDTLAIAAGVYPESDIVIDKPLHIIGAGVGATVIDGGGGTQSIVRFSPSAPAQATTIANVTLTHGYRGVHAGDCATGYVDITLDHVRITDNGPGSGAGVFNNCGVVRVFSSQIDHNHASAADFSGCDWGWGGTGGAIASLCGGGWNEIRNSTINDNTADYVGGGLLVNDGTALIENSTFSGNRALSTDMNGGVAPDLGGGAIFIAGTFPKVTVRFSTIADNAAPNGAGGGILGGQGEAAFGSFLSLESTIFADNMAPSSSSVYAQRTGPVTGTGNCSPWKDNQILSLGGNIVSDDACPMSAAPDLSSIVADLAGTSVALGPLQNNGGPTPTRSIAAVSPAADRSPNCGVTGSAFNTVAAYLLPELVGADQRGTTRPQGAACDSGAFELSNGSPAGQVLILITGKNAVCIGSNSAGECGIGGTVRVIVPRPFIPR